MDPLRILHAQMSINSVALVTWLKDQVRLSSDQAAFPDRKPNHPHHCDRTLTTCGSTARTCTPRTSTCDGAIAHVIGSLCAMARAALAEFDGENEPKKAEGAMGAMEA